MKLLAFALPALLLAEPTAPAPLVVKVSPAASPCLAAALPILERSAGRRVSLLTEAIGPARSGAGADVVVAAQQELTRVIEGGASLPEDETDVARIPWVLLGSGAATPELRALERGEARVRVLGGAVGREARQWLAGLGPDRVRSVRGAAELAPLAPDELALVPLSLAGPGAATATSVPPLLVQAVIVRESRQLDAARAFVRSLATGDAAAAFSACGRGPRR